MPRRLLKTKAPLFVLLATLFYFAMWYTIQHGPLASAILLVGIGGVVLTLIRLAPATWDSLINGARDPWDQLPIGITLVFGGLATRYTLSTLWEFIGEPPGWDDHPLNLMITYWIVIGVLFYLFSTRSQAGWSQRTWMTVTVGLIVLAAAVGAVFSLLAEHRVVL